MPGTAILSPGVGYGIVLGISAGFAAIMIAITKVQTKYTVFKTSNLSEFVSASHSVKPGLIACAIVSSWTWAATLLTSAAQSYKNGMIGGYSYAAAASFQIVLFSIMSAKIKLNAPRAHTFLEVIRVRWGTTAHIVFLFFSLATSLLVSAMLVTGGSSTVSDLTGASTPAICVLMPLGVAGYVLVGGLRSSLLADFIHTAALFVIILAFHFYVYTKSPEIGSVSKMYELLQQASVDYPVEGNKDGSYLTFRSKPGLIFMVINLCTNLGTVFADQAYWQRALASEPSTAVKGYLLGGSAWMSIPLGFSAALGLSAAVLRNNISFPGYPNGLSDAEVSAGLPAAAAAQVLLGAGGAAVLLVLLFLAVTSATAAELCAVSTLATYDIFIPYIKPGASDRTVLLFDHCAIVAYGAIMAILGIVLYYAGISLGFLYNFTGILVASAVLPIAMCIMWRKANKWACITATVLPSALGITGWLVTAAKLNDGVINIHTTQQDYPMLTGNVISLGLSIIISLVGSFLWPEDYDFEPTRQLHAHSEASEEVVVPGADTPSSGFDTPSEEKKESEIVATPQIDSEASSIAHGLDADSVKSITRAYKLARIVSVPVFFILIILIPIPLALAGGGYVSSLAGFKAYISITFIWLFWGAAAVVLYPLWEYRKSLAEISSNIWADLRGQRIHSSACKAEE
ncbi:hypothetical protein JCM10212_003194 [Sporobolomyces blumeae]